MDGSPCLSHMQRVRVKGLIIQLWLLISQQQDRHCLFNGTNCSLSAGTLSLAWKRLHPEPILSFPVLYALLVFVQVVQTHADHFPRVCVCVRARAHELSCCAIPSLACFYVRRRVFLILEGGDSVQCPVPVS